MNIRQKFGTEQISLFKEMVARVPAYKEFLKNNNFNYKKVDSYKDLELIPIMDKKNYIDIFDIEKLCWDGDIKNANYIVNSSGSTGIPYFWTRDTESDRSSAHIYKIIFEKIFELDDREPILLVNSFGQGSWIAGNEAFLSVYLNESMPILTINSGIDEDLIIQQLRTLAKNFRKIIFTGYPPFIKDLFMPIESARIINNSHSVFVIVGGESISEGWRNKVQSIFRSAKKTEIVSIYGMSDGGGIQAFETSITKKIRSEIFKNNLTDQFGGLSNTALFQYDPNIRHFSVAENSNILIDVEHGLPLFRYDTKDVGGLLGFEEGIKILEKTSSDTIKHNIFSNYPFIYLLGRSDYATTFYGLNIYPEHVRSVIDGLADTDLTGIFVVESQENRNADPELIVRVELVKNINSSIDLSEKKDQIAFYIFDNLPKYNSEYGKLVESIQEKAMPKVVLTEFGNIGYKKGKKHKWVKRD